MIPGRGRTIALVAGGYAAAWAIASLAENARYRSTQGPDSQASGGMYAGGDMILWAAVFCLVALVPTTIALRALRGVPRFWRVAPRIALAGAATGPLAVLVMVALTTFPVAGKAAELLMILGAARGFASLPAIAFDGLFALISPERGARRTFVLAGLVELASVVLAVLRGLGVFRIH